MCNKRAVYDHETRNAVKWVDVNDGTPGDCPEGRIPVINRRGERVAHMGHKGGASVARRLLQSNRHVELATLHGRPAWIETNDPVAVADQTNARLKHAKDLAAAKGSVTKHPTPPKTTARPKR